MPLQLPNLFLPGFARCGTTHLNYILSQHPDIHTGTIDEANFFNWPLQDINNPLRYFTLSDSPKRYRKDYSVTYIANPLTARVLRSLFPSAKYVVMLRNPKARAYSLFQLTRMLKCEDFESFCDALKAETSRASSQHFATTYLDPWFNLYTRSTLYDEHLKPYLSEIDRGQFHFVSLAELSHKPLATTESILRFLDLDPSPAKNFDFRVRGWSGRAGAPAWDSESDQIMNAAFDGLTERTDILIGRALDWTL